MLFESLMTVILLGFAQFFENFLVAILYVKEVLESEENEDCGTMKKNYRSHFTVQFVHI